MLAVGGCGQALESSPETFGVGAEALVWATQPRLDASADAEDARFGSSLALGGDTVLVGARHDSASLYQQGAAYAFVREGTTWSEQAKLIASGVTAPSTDFEAEPRPLGAAVDIGADELRP